MKLLIAINNNNGLYSKLSEHFGHCLYFALYETTTKELKIVENIIDHSKISLTPVDQVMQFEPDIVFSLAIGQRALNLFDEKDVKVKTGDFKILKEVINNFNQLKELTVGCVH